MDTQKTVVVAERTAPTADVMAEVLANINDILWAFEAEHITSVDACDDIAALLDHKWGSLPLRVPEHGQTA